MLLGSWNKYLPHKTKENTVHLSNRLALVRSMLERICAFSYGEGWLI